MKCPRVCLVVALAMIGCAVKHTATPKSGAAANLPFDPSTIRADPAGELGAKGPYKVELAVRATRDLTEADHVALRVVATGTEVASVPVVVDVPPDWNGQHGAKVFSATVAIPAGDYDVELVYQGKPILGHAFRLADVPVWGGGHQVHFFWHQRNRIDLDAEWLRLARWVVEDEPTQASVIEWWHDGRRVLVTKGRTDAWPAYQADAAVQNATPKKGPGPRKTIWAFGSERYKIPKDLILIAGQWEARVYREGAPPVAVAFELSTAEETLESRVALTGAHLSAELFLRPLPSGLGADGFAAVPGKQYPTAPARTTLTLVEPIAFDRSAMRALFRSPELAKKWSEFLAANNTSAQFSNGVKLANEQDWNLSAEEKQLLARQTSAQKGRDPDQIDADRLAKVKRLRPQIVALIKKHSGPWQDSERPR